MLDSVLLYFQHRNGGSMRNDNILSTDPLRALDNISLVMRNDSTFFPIDDLSNSWSAKST